MTDLWRITQVLPYSAVGGLALAGYGLYELTQGVLVVDIISAPTPTLLIVLVGLGMIGGGGYGVLREIGSLTRR